MNPANPLRGNAITYYEFPPDDARRDAHAALGEILNDCNPDIVHIFGTEYPHARRMAELCAAQSRPFVVSLQGLVYYCAMHYATGVPGNVQRRFTFRDLVKRDNLRLQQDGMRRRGIDELATLRIASHVIGRTSWDRACLSQVNSKAHYHKCNEILRSSFYDAKWNLAECEPYSIFASQGAYPIKGLHFMIEALPIILRQFPGAHLFVAGHDVTGAGSITGRLRLTSYGKYIRDLIRRYGLENAVTFTGPLDELAMRKRFLASQVFALPSTIENSSNSLGEAMLLGVPTVAAAVGGVGDMAQPEVDALAYQVDAPYMLAHQICRIFRSDSLAQQLGAHAMERAQATHDPARNTHRLLAIYSAILTESGTA